MGSARIACVGDLLVEFVAASKNGRHRRPDTYTGPLPSGAAGIFIDQAARSGGQCIFVGAVGDDAFGGVVIDRLVADGVDPSLIKIVKGVPTGTAFVSYNDDGSRDFVYNIVLSAAAQFEAGPDVVAALAAFKPDYVHISGSALGDAKMGAKVISICKAMREQGFKISFDPNVRKELAGDPGYFRLVNDALAMSSIFLPSEDDLAALFPGESFNAIAAKLFTKGMDYVVLKKGEHGSEGISRTGDRVALPAHNVEVLDPTGAGDTFCAAFVTAIASTDDDFGGAMALANAAGALAVTKVGPMEGTSHRATLEAFLRGDP
jgi:sugar/nucleoside kinase (ribokinase family)